MMLLNDGVKYVPSASTSVEMQLNENKRTNSEQIAAIFGLSPEIISGTADTQTYMSAVRTAVIPVVEAYQAALNKSLLRESEKGRLYFTLDTTELLKGDTLSRYQAYAIGLKNNFLQIDEVRYLEDKEPIGFNYVKLGLQDVLLDPKTGTVYTPNTNQTALVGRKPPARELTTSADCGIMESDETRGKDNWVKGEHGYFKGSTPSGGGNSSGKGLTNSKSSGIMGVGSDDVTISSIDSPIEQKHTGKGNPNAIVHFDVELNNRQQALLNALPEYDSRITVPRDSVNMTDLSALTAKTGNEFAMFTKGGNRLVIRGNEYKVNIDIEQAKSLAAQGYKWSGHTHPGIGYNVLMPSKGDKEILRQFPQKISVIYNSNGKYNTFGKE